MKSFCKLSEDSNPSRFIPDVLPLIYETGKMYFDWMFGGEKPSLKILERWLQSPSSEFSISRMTILFEDNQPIGEFISIGGEKSFTGTKDMIEMIKGKSYEEKKELIFRLAEVKKLFPPNEPGEYFLRTLGVFLEHRGKGIGRMLIDKFIEQGIELGYHRLRLTVRANNIPAIKLYESVGFRIISENIFRGNGEKILTMISDKA